MTSGFSLVPGQANMHNRMLDSKAIVVRAVHLLLPAFVNALGDNKQVCILTLLAVSLLLVSMRHETQSSRDWHFLY